MRLLALAATVLCLGAASRAGAQGLPLGHPSSPRSIAPTALATLDDPIGALIAHRSVSGAGDPMRWRASQFQLAPVRRGGAVDSLRLTTADALRNPGRPSLAYDRSAAVDTAGYEVALVRDWPRAVSFGAAGLNFDVSPHAGVGVGSMGKSAEAGATVSLGRREDAVVRRLNEMGVRDGARFGDAGRWYLFAAASGRAVGLNLQHNSDGWGREGWSTDPAAATIADAQVGIGWRSGAMQTSFGYLRREVKTDHKVWGQETHADSLVALSFSIRPGR